MLWNVYYIMIVFLCLKTDVDILKIWAAKGDKYIFIIYELSTKFIVRHKG